MLTRLGGSRSISVPNIFKICKSVAKILRFFNFSKWRPVPYWIFKFKKFHRQAVSERPRLIIVINVVKIGRSVAEILRFFEFSRLPQTPSWTFEITKFYWQLGCRRSRRSDKWSDKLGIVRSGLGLLLVVR